ncbi:MAG: SPFH domain-containing protein [Candidatus Methanomethylophilaceae archaeon]|nr:SPFH domain-containing protein [Candidatus Methanomethylophilaceae archaeon]
MGLIKALAGSVSGTLADQWKEFFYCESMPKEILMIKGVKQVGKRSTNTKGSDNIISNGSGIAVADGQCMIIVESGKVVEICSEPGTYTYDTSTEPSIFTGGLGKGVINTFKTMGRRFAYGGDTGKDQRVYYFNMKEILDNKFGTSTPIPFRVVDRNIGLDIDVSVRCFGVFSYKISDPILFYTNVCGNVKDQYSRTEIDDQLKTEFIAALQPGFGKLSDLGLRPNQLVNHSEELQDAMNEALSKKWSETRGLDVVSVAIGSVTLPPEDAELIKNAQKAGMLRDPSMAGATLVEAQASALKTAAGNEAGAVTGLMGVGMIGQMGGGGMNAGAYYDRADQQRQQQQAAQEAQPAAGAWKCACGATATGKFCPECGAKKPEVTGWTCQCGHVNKGKFCTECGAKKPAGVPKFRCDKCGWEPADPSKPPKFCPECGDPFNDEDMV